MKWIRLSKYIGKDTTVLSGTLAGREMAEASNITELCNEGEVNIVMSKDMWFVASSFWVGLLYDVIVNGKIGNVTVNKNKLVGMEMEINTIGKHDSFDSYFSERTRILDKCPFVLNNSVI